MLDDLMRDPVALLLGGLIVFGFACLAASDLWTAWRLRREDRNRERESARLVERAMQDAAMRAARKRLTDTTATRNHLERNR